VAQFSALGGETCRAADKCSAIKMNNANKSPERVCFSISSGARTETAKSRFIRLLTFISRADGPLSTDDNTTDDDLLALTELYLGGFISVEELARDAMGRVCYITCVEITPSGRAYLAELQREGEAQTSMGLIKQNRFHAYRRFFVIMGAIISGYIVWLLTH
jgi:hypothetical protein